MNWSPGKHVEVIVLGAEPVSDESGAAGVVLEVCVVMCECGSHAEEMRMQVFNAQLLLTRDASGQLELAVLEDRDDDTPAERPRSGASERATDGRGSCVRTAARRHRPCHDACSGGMRAQRRLRKRWPANNHGGVYKAIIAG